MQSKEAKPTASWYMVTYCVVLRSGLRSGSNAGVGVGARRWLRCMLATADADGPRRRCQYPVSEVVRGHAVLSAYGIRRAVVVEYVRVVSPRS